MNLHRATAQRSSLTSPSYRLRETDTRLPSRVHVVEGGVPVLQKGVAYHVQVPLRRNVRPHYSSHTSLRRGVVRLPYPLDRPRRHLRLQSDRQRLVAHQPRERRRQESEVEVERVDREGLAGELDGGDEGGGHGAGVREERLVAGAGEGDGEGVGDQLEDGVRGGRGGEDERGAGVDDRLAGGVVAGREAVHVHGVEGDLPVGGLRDGDLREGAYVP